MEIGTYGYNENWDISVQWKLGHIGIGTLHTYVSLTYRNVFLSHTNIQTIVKYSIVDLDTMHQLHHQTMPTVLLHLAEHCVHKIT